ncbi:MAG: YecA family protein [Limisphaerales bacterium]
MGKRVVEMTPQLQADPETLRLAELVSTRLGHTAWEDLHRWFWTAKIQAIETAEVSEIDIVGLPNADDGHLIPFIEVFPLGLSLNFTFENAAWAADEAYCVQPDCRCTEMVLSFFLLREAAGRRATSLRDVPAIRYNYRSQAIRELAPGLAGTPPTRQLLGALKTAYPSLDTRLELHHRIMQLLYARHDAAQAKLEHERLRAQLPSGASRTGRNDPCPCGSGKKFKKCCGA